jgi:hypothetical protein
MLHSVKTLRPGSGLIGQYAPRAVADLAPTGRGDPGENQSGSGRKRGRAGAEHKNNGYEYLPVR